MKWKNPKDEQEWHSHSYAPDTIEEGELLRWYIMTLDNISVMLGFDEITITSFVRLNNKKSWHYWGRALDMRIKDKSTEWYLAMIAIGNAFKQLDSRLFMQPHVELFRKDHQHIHIHIGRKDE